MNSAAERVWAWVFEFKVDPTQAKLDEANSILFDEKLKWLCENETDENILRSYAVLKNNLPKPQIWGEGREKFENKFGKQIIEGSRGGVWTEGYPKPDWAENKKTPIEMNGPSHRVWSWIFEFKVDPTQAKLDEANSILFDEKLKWLCENETDENILRSYAVLKKNLPTPKICGEGKEKFVEKFGKHIFEGLRGGPWMEGYEKPEWAENRKTPLETLKSKTLQ